MLTGEEMLKQFPVGSYAKIVGLDTIWKEAYADSRYRKKLQARSKQRIGQVVQILYVVNASTTWAYFIVQPVSGGQKKRATEIGIDISDLEPITILDLLADI